MKRLNEKSSNTALYAQIENMLMSGHEREVALNAIRNAEAIVDGYLWIVNGVKHLIARISEIPAGLKHSH